MNTKVQIPLHYSLTGPDGRVNQPWAFFLQELTNNLPSGNNNPVISPTETTIIQGLDADKGTANAGDIYFALDTGKIYVVDSNGDWILQAPAYTGDAISSANSNILSLKTVNLNPGTYGTASTIPRISVDSKGRVLSVIEEPVVAGAVAAAGGNGQIQYNSGGLLGASPSFAYDPATNTLSIVNQNLLGVLRLNGNSGSAKQAIISNGSSAPTWQAITNSFNTRTGEVTLTSLDVTTALGYIPGTVSSVAATGNNGITVSGSPITTSGTITLGLGDITPNKVTIGQAAGSDGLVFTNASYVRYPGQLRFQNSVANGNGLLEVFSNRATGPGGASTRYYSNTSGTDYNQLTVGINTGTGGPVILSQVSGSATNQPILIQSNNAGATVSTSISIQSATAGSVANRGSVTVNGDLITTGNITGANLSGTNTGDQTITLTGDVTGSGTGTFATTLSSTGVSPGTYTNATITVDAKGRVSYAATGSGGGGGTDQTPVRLYTTFTVQTDKQVLFSEPIEIEIGGELIVDGDLIGVSNCGSVISGITGTATLVGGTITINNGLITANSRIFLTSQVDGGTPGFLRVSTRTPGVDFTITSSSPSDTSTVAYMIVEP